MLLFFVIIFYVLLTFYNSISVARHVQKHSRLLAVVESLDNGKSIREARDCDVPLLVRHLYYHAGWAQLMDTEMANWKPVGKLLI